MILTKTWKETFEENDGGRWAFSLCGFGVQLIGKVVDADIESQTITLENSDDEGGIERATVCAAQVVCFHASKKPQPDDTLN